MSQAPDETGVPPLTLGWRLRMSREYAHISVEDMASHLEISRSTISRWEHDGGSPKQLFLSEWARLSGVPLGWLTGKTPPAATKPAQKRKNGRRTANHSYREKGVLGHAA